MLNYSCSQVSMVYTSPLAGAVVLTGFQENDMVELKRDNESSVLKKGAKGENSRYMTNDKSGTITIYLEQTSQCNKQLDALIKLDEASGLGAGTFVLNNLLGLEGAIATDCFITKPADRKLGKELNGREWVLKAGDLDYT